MKKYRHPEAVWEVEQQISEYVRDGRGHELIDIFPDVQTNPPPERVGQWGIMVIHGHHHATKQPEIHIVAKPLTVLARNLSYTGNVARLTNKGLTVEHAEHYVEAARGVSNAWVEQVIDLVLLVIKEKVSEDAIRAVYHSSDPRQMAKSIALCPNVYSYTFKRFTSALQILINYHEEIKKQQEQLEEDKLLQAA